MIYSECKLTVFKDTKFYSIFEDNGNIWIKNGDDEIMEIKPDKFFEWVSKLWNKEF